MTEDLVALLTILVPAALTYALGWRHGRSRGCRRPRPRHRDDK